MDRTFRNAVRRASEFQKQNPSLFASDIVEVEQPLVDAFQAEVDTKILGPYAMDACPPPNAEYVKNDDDTFAVFYMKHQPFCLRRLGIVKEFCQILTDDESVAADSAYEQLKFATREIVRPTFEALDEVISSEHFCYFMAEEMLIPPHRRAVIEGMRDEKCKMIDLATEVRIPLSSIEGMMMSMQWTISQKLRKSL